MREKSGSDFTVDVDGIGRFQFARRTVKDVFRIRALYNELTGGYVDEAGNLDVYAASFAAIKTLMVEAPAGFDPDKVDPLVTPEWEDPYLTVFRALRAKELSFRKDKDTPVEGPGAQPAGELRAVVPEEV